MKRFSALVLAGSRGPDDPVAGPEGVAAKALVTVGGVPMLARVVHALRDAGAGQIAVAASHQDVIDLVHDLGCLPVPAASGPSQSAAWGFAMLGAPMVLTTADHALLQAEWIEDFVRAADGDADVSVLLARRDVVEAAVPDTRRTWLRFADGQWSGCNLFYCATPRAAAAFALWQAVERDRKRPWRIVWRLGPAMLLRYVLGRLPLSEAMSSLGRRAGLKVAAVPSAHGLAAVDVDKPADLALVRRIVGAAGAP